ncbi:DUF1302 family protein [Parvibaculum lavamentivorans]|uniref:DUF1302 family protein n=1 Tax=Parvibaculum lavamentivorans TaxID=256618 RepID=UPI0000ED404A|nr:DUF1302 family protein [Parvibaculum lavamentivorans]
MIVSTGFKPVTNEPAVRIRRLGASTAIATLFVSSFLFSTAASAESFVFGDAKLTIDSTVSAGATMRTSDRDCQRVSVANGGCAPAGTKATGVNSDNGNLNFDKGDITNAIVKATSDIQLTWQNYGALHSSARFL